MYVCVCSQLMMNAGKCALKNQHKSLNKSLINAIIVYANIVPFAWRSERK